MALAFRPPEQTARHRPRGVCGSSNERFVPDRHPVRQIHDRLPSHPELSEEIPAHAVSPPRCVSILRGQTAELSSFYSLPHYLSYDPIGQGGTGDTCSGSYRKLVTVLENLPSWASSDGTPMRKGEGGDSVRVASRQQGRQIAKWLAAWNALDALEAFWGAQGAVTRGAAIDRVLELRALMTALLKQASLKVIPGPCHPAGLPTCQRRSRRRSDPPMLLSEPASRNSTPPSR